MVSSSQPKLPQDTSNEIPPIINKLSTLAIREYDIDDVIFKIHTAQASRQPYQESNVIGQLVSLGEKPNQTVFIYVGIDKPIRQPMQKINEEPFCNSLHYLSPYMQSFFQRYFDSCHWKGYGLG